MNRTGRTILIGIFVLMPLCAAVGAKNNSINDLRGLQLNHAKIPIFNRSRLQMMVFAGRAERRGEVLAGFDTVLEIIRASADVDSINDSWEMKPYPLGAPLNEVLAFWKDRISYSDGVMNTSECEIDQPRRRAYGTRDVHFRSPMLDLDGVGFEADFNRRTISVNSQVNIVIRQSSADPAVLLKTPDKLPAKYEFLTARGDSMLIDSNRNEVMLIGNVRVDEERAFLTCDRLTVFWGSKSDKDDKSGKDGKDGKDGATDLQSAGIDRILADGDVVITKKDNPAEQLFTDHLICDVRKGTIKLAGDEELPRIVSANGEVLCGRNVLFERDTKRALVTGGCRIDGAPERDENGKKVVRQSLSADSGFFDSIRNFNDFTGHVRMRDGGRSISCDRMRVITVGGSKKAKKSQSERADRGKDTTELFSADELGGSREIKSADFHGNVLLSDDGKSNLSCQEMHADFARSKSGKTELVGAKWFRNVRVESLGNDAGAEPGVITSDRGELDNIGDRVTFEGHVKGRRLKSTLDCRRLDLYLGKKSASEAPASGSIAAGAGSDRTIKKAVATDNVHVVDASGTLDCNILSLFFDELPPGAKPAPGMFQSGGVRLTDIVADGKVVATNRASAESEKQPGIFSGKSSGNRILRAEHGQVDLVRDLSHFSGGVKINDAENLLLCDEMFLFGTRSTPPKPTRRDEFQAEDPDADPFALPEFTEDTVPAAINITDDVRLQRVLCVGNVKLERTDPATRRKQEAGGDRCEYLTNTRVITLTDTPPRRPWLRAEGRQQYGSRIVYDLKDNIFRSYDTDTFTIERKNPGI
jgi:lipopolysaccharide export system protein LptA